MNEKKTWKIGRLVITATRWPNQGYGWFPHKNGRGPRAMLNAGGARFGAGWNYKLGIDFGGRSVLLNLLFGMLIISLERKS